MQARLESFLEDPLIISFVAELVEKHGKGGLGVLPRKGERAQFLKHLVEQLLRREQLKRTRHRGIDFDQFQRILHSVAFSLVCRGSKSIAPSQLEAYVERAADPAFESEEVVDAFRTISWIHRSDEGDLSFRHEALTVVCAAEHLCAAIERRDALSLSEWQNSAPLAPVVLDTASEMITSSGMLGATALLGSDPPFNVRTLIADLLQLTRHREGSFPVVNAVALEEKALAALCRGIVEVPNLSQGTIDILFRSVGDKRRMQLMTPLLCLLARKEAQGSVAVAVSILGPKIRPKFDFDDELRTVRSDVSSYLDVMLLKDLRLTAGEVQDLTQYESLFRRMKADTSIDAHAVQYAERTLRSVDGEKQRRENQFERHSKS